MKKLFPLIVALLLLLPVVNAQNFIKIDTSFYSEVLQETKEIVVYLPPDYYTNSAQEYAVIYFLHGAGGDQNSGNNRAISYYNTYFNSTDQLAPPAIFVCLDGSCEPYRGSNYVNSVLYGQYEDYTVQDAIEFIESNYRAHPYGPFRMITGWSMGGFGSSRLSAEYPELFRACIPCIGFLRSTSDTLLNTWKELVYMENGSYKVNYNSGIHSKLFITMCGGLSPNLDILPYYIETPFDTLGNYVDTVIAKWDEFDVASMVKDLPPTDELAWFLIAGIYDHMASYTTYLEFMDSMDYYGREYETAFFNGGHEYDEASWQATGPWIDSIFNISFTNLYDPELPQYVSELLLYPNPASEILHISGWHAALEVNIYSLSGQKAFSGSVQNSIDVSGFNDGIYILEARTENGVVREKFIKR